MDTFDHDLIDRDLAWRHWNGGEEQNSGGFTRPGKQPHTVTIERSTIFNGKTHYKWPFFNSYVSLPEGTPSNRTVQDWYV